MSVFADQVAPRRKRGRPRGSTNKPKEGLGRGQRPAGPGRPRGSRARGRGRGRGRGQLADNVTVHEEIVPDVVPVPDVEVDEAVGR